MKIFFFHNQKAGGTAVASALRTLFLPSRCCPLIVNDMIGHASLGGNYEKFRGYDYYGGHYGYDIYSALRRDHLPITNFRDPISRLVSHYNYFRYAVQLPFAALRSERYYAVRFAKTATFVDFALSDDPRVSVYTKNQHFRQLTGTCWCPSVARSVAEACELIDGMPWFYVCEYPQISMNWASVAFADRLPRILIENRTFGPDGRFVRRNDLDPGSLRAIRERNLLDIALYEHAVQRLLDTTEALPARPDADDQSARVMQRTERPITAQHPDAPR
jgi:hypothetical protein